MENNYLSITDPTSEQFIALLQQAIRLRYKLYLPEHVSRCKQHVIDSLQINKTGGAEDYRFIMRIFVFLTSREKPPTMGEISLELNTPLSTATRIIDWLVQSDIIERVSDPDDRRIVRISMSNTGHEFYQTFLDYNKKRIEQLMSHFSTDEQVQFLKTTGKLLDLLLSDETN